MHIFEYTTGGVIAFSLACYLMYALLFPEKF